MKKINGMFDELEKAREKFIKDNAGEEAYKNWKKELEEKRSEARAELKAAEKENTTALDRMKKAVVSYRAVREAESFTEDEMKLVKKNNNPHGSWDDRQEDRVLKTFILPVYRDFSGAYMTEQDRYNADFNKRFKSAMTKGDEEEIKNLSREFTEQVLSKAAHYDPEGTEELTPEEAEEKFVNSGLINYTHIKLRMTGNVNHPTQNTNYPLLKTGLDELEKNDPGQYTKIRGELDKLDNALFEHYMNANGYDTYNMIPIPERGVEGYKMIFQNSFREYKESESSKK